MEFDWRKNYILPSITTINRYLRSFQYKIFNKLLFLNKKSFVFESKIHQSYFCKTEKQTQLHIFSECISMIYLWQQLASFLKTIWLCQYLPAQTALLFLWSDNTNHDEPIKNHIWLIFKLHVYNSTEKHRLNKWTEYRLSSKNVKKERSIKSNGA